MVLSGEYLPASHGAPDHPGNSLGLPSGGAVLQRVTLVASQPDSTVVMLRADYAAPQVLAPRPTYEALVSRPGTTAYPATSVEDPAIGAQARPGRSGSIASAYSGRGAPSAQKGGFIDVHA